MVLHGLNLQIFYIVFTRMCLNLFHPWHFSLHYFLISIQLKNFLCNMYACKDSCYALLYEIFLMIVAAPDEARLKIFSEFCGVLYPRELGHLHYNFFQSSDTPKFWFWLHINNVLHSCSVYFIFRCPSLGYGDVYSDVK